MNQATDEEKQNILDRVTRSEVASMVLAMTRAPRMRMTSTIPSWGHSDDRFGMVSAIKAGDISAAFDHAAIATNRYFCDFLRPPQEFYTNPNILWGCKEAM